MRLEFYKTMLKLALWSGNREAIRRWAQTYILAVRERDEKC